MPNPSGPFRKLATEIAPILDIQEQCRNKAVIIIGDIHECFDELEKVLDIIKWNPKIHLLIFVGDLNDRAPKKKNKKRKRWLFAIQP